jgi:hypothetical protein
VIVFAVIVFAVIVFAASVSAAFVSAAPSCLAARRSDPMQQAL